MVPAKALNWLIDLKRSPLDDYKDAKAAEEACSQGNISYHAAK